MKRSPIFIFVVLTISAACGGSGASNDTSASIPENTASASVVPNVPTNAAILEMAYDPNYHVPEGFFVDERVETTVRSFSLHHVLDETNTFELCTDDLVIAQEWEQADNDSRAVNGYYVTSIENDRYFEFVRELEYNEDVGNVGEPTSPGYARVFKCNFVDRAGVDRNSREGYAGQLNAEPLSAESLKNLVEYLWQFRFFNVSRKAVIASYGGETIDGAHHALALALVVNQGVDRCDRVDVVEWRFTSDLASGNIDRAFDTIRSFEADLINGIPQFCD